MQHLGKSDLLLTNQLVNNVPQKPTETTETPDA
jgi:hypothetical protein